MKSAATIILIWISAIALVTVLFIGTVATSKRKHCFRTIDVDDRRCRLIDYCSPCSPVEEWHERAVCELDGGKPEGDDCR